MNNNENNNDNNNDNMNNIPKLNINNKIKNIDGSTENTNTINNPTLDKFSKFNINNIIKIDNKIGIIKNIDKDNLLIDYKLLKNLTNMKDNLKTYSFDESMIENVKIIANTKEDLKNILNNYEIINDKRPQLNKQWLDFFSDNKWFSIENKSNLTEKNTLSDFLVYIYNNILLYSKLTEKKQIELNKLFEEEYDNIKIDINTININANILPSNYLNNIRKNIKIKLLNNIKIEHFNDLKLINMFKTSNYNYENYLIDYYNIYNIIKQYKQSNIKLNNNICKDLIIEYKNKCDNSFIHVSDCNKTQLKLAQEQRAKLNQKIKLLEDTN